MVSALLSCDLKLGRARELFDLIHDEIARSMRERPFQLVKERCPDGSWQRFLFTGGFSDEELRRWALLCGDCVHNIRSALDHFVYGLAIRHSGVNPPPNADKLQFPICQSHDDFLTKQRMIAPLSETAKNFIEGAQPYHQRPGANHSSSLGVLGKLDIIDKHRLLTVTAAAVGSATIRCEHSSV